MTCIRASYAGPVNWNFKSGSGTAAAKDRTASLKDGKGIDVEAVGTVNGVSIHEFDLDSVDDKPWRKPGKKLCHCSASPRVLSTRYNSLLSHMESGDAWQLSPLHLLLGSSCNAPPH